MKKIIECGEFYWLKNNTIKWHNTEFMGDYNT